MYRIDCRGYQVALECSNVDITNRGAGWTASARIETQDTPVMIVRVPGRYCSEHEALAAALQEVRIRLVQVDNEVRNALPSR